MDESKHQAFTKYKWLPDKNNLPTLKKSWCFILHRYPSCHSRTLPPLWDHGGRANICPTRGDARPTFRNAVVFSPSLQHPHRKSLKWSLHTASFYKDVLLIISMLWKGGGASCRPVKIQLFSASRGKNCACLRCGAQKLGVWWHPEEKCAYDMFSNKYNIWEYLQRELTEPMNWQHKTHELSDANEVLKNVTGWCPDSLFVCVCVFVCSHPKNVR